MQSSRNMHERDDGSQDKAETVTVATSIKGASGRGCQKCAREPSATRRRGTRSLRFSSKSGPRPKMPKSSIEGRTSLQKRKKQRSMRPNRPSNGGCCGEKKKRADFQGVPGGVPKAPRRLESLQLQCFWRRPSMKRALEKGCRRQRCRAGGGRPGQVPSERPETSTGARIVPGRLAVNAEASRSLRFSRKT